MPWSHAVAWLLVFSRPDMPPIEDAHRFPSRAAASTAREFNRKYREHIETVQAFEPRNYIECQEILQETDWCYHCWNVLDNVHGSSGTDIETRRAALRELRILIGEQAYCEGRMPPCVPVWRLRVVGAP